MCIRGRRGSEGQAGRGPEASGAPYTPATDTLSPASYTHLRAHETVLALVCRLLLEHKKTTATQSSGAPLPYPILVSAGFLLMCLSGTILIQTLPSLFI